MLHHFRPIEGALLALLLMAMFAVVSVGEIGLIERLGLGATALAGLYLAFIYALNRYDRGHVWQPVDMPVDTEHEPRREPELVARLAAAQFGAEIMRYGSCHFGVRCFVGGCV